MLGLDIAYMYAKFDQASVSHSRDIVGGLVPTKICVLRDLTTPLSGIICHHGLALATINLSTKFEVSISTHYDHYERLYKITKIGWIE